MENSMRDIFHRLSHVLRTDTQHLNSGLRSETQLQYTQCKFWVLIRHPDKTRWGSQKRSWRNYCRQKTVMSGRLGLEHSNMWIEHRSVVKLTSFVQTICDILDIKDNAWFTICWWLNLTIYGLSKDWQIGNFEQLSTVTPVSYTHLTLPTTSFV